MPNKSDHPWKRMRFLTHELDLTADPYQAFTAPRDWPIREGKELAESARNSQLRCDRHEHST